MPETLFSQSEGSSQREGGHTAAHWWAHGDAGPCSRIALTDYLWHVNIENYSYYWLSHCSLTPSVFKPCFLFPIVKKSATCVPEIKKSAQSQCDTWVLCTRAPLWYFHKHVNSTIQARFLHSSREYNANLKWGMLKRNKVTQTGRRSVSNWNRQACKAPL